MLPDSTCPYAHQADWRLEARCEHLDRARAANPLRFRVASATGYYERTDMKAAPYSTLEAMQIRFGGFSASRFEIEWAPESYASHASDQHAAGKHAAGKHDYGLVRESTRKLGVPKTFAPVLYKDDGSLDEASN